MFSPPSCRVGLILIVLYSSCVSHHVNVVFYRVSGQQFSWSEQRMIQTIADATVREVRQMLPMLPASLTLRVELGQQVDPETGATIAPRPPDMIYWTVDSAREGGASEVARAQLRAELFHSLYHLARTVAARPGHTLQDQMVSVGLATVFERDFGGGSVPWGAYPPQVDTWVEEVLALPSDARLDHWMDRHPDGRRWIGPKVGTYLVDRAIRASRRSVADLVSASTDDIIRMALRR